LLECAFHGDGDRAGWQFLLHDDVAATSADLLEADFA